MSSLLDSVLQRQERGHDDRASTAAPAAKRVRQEGKTLFHTFAETLYAMRGSTLAASIPLKEVEIEVRVGMLVMDVRRWRSMIAGGMCIYLTDALRTQGDIKFDAGIDEVMFDRLKRVFSHENFPCDRLQTSRVRIDRAGERVLLLFS